MKRISEPKPQRFLISRTDNIGDVVLTLPVAALLKQYFPGCHVTFLARNYVKAIVENCTAVDRFLSWDQLQALPNDKAVQQLKTLEFDTCIHVFPNKKVAALVKRAKIRYRIGTSRRYYHWSTCNYRVSFSRAKANTHEAQLNLKLLLPLGIPDDLSKKTLTQLIKINTPVLVNKKIQSWLKPDRFNLIVHPMSNGNGKEWPLAHFKQLIQALPSDYFNVLITGSPAESKLLQAPLIQHCPNAIDTSGNLTLDELITLIAHSDGMVVSSTGPLHIAAALGIHALGLFPPQVGYNPQRWQPLGPKAEVLMTQRDCNLCQNNPVCECMQMITPQQVQQALQRWAETKLTAEPSHAIT